MIGRQRFIVVRRVETDDSSAWVSIAFNVEELIKQTQ